MDIRVTEGLSGAPVFLERNNVFSLIGMVIATIGSNGQYTVALNSFTIETVVQRIIQNYIINKRVYKNDLVKLGVVTDNGLTRKWLGIIGYYNDPINTRADDSSLINLKYNGGLVIKKFILGFDFVKKAFVYDTESLVQGSVIPLTGPLLNTKMYNRFIESNKNHWL